MSLNPIATAGIFMKFFFNYKDPVSFFECLFIPLQKLLYHDQDHGGSRTYPWNTAQEYIMDGMPVHCSTPYSTIIHTLGGI